MPTKFHFFSFSISRLIELICPPSQITILDQFCHYQCGWIDNSLFDNSSISSKREALDELKKGNIGRVSLNRIMGQVDSVRAYELAIRAWTEYSHQALLI